MPRRATRNQQQHNQKAPPIDPICMPSKQKKSFKEKKDIAHVVHHPFSQFNLIVIFFSITQKDLHVFVLRENCLFTVRP